MMRFDLQVNDNTVTRVSVLRKGYASDPDGDDPSYVYEWNAWRINPALPTPGILYYAAGELVHRYADGIEELAIKVLQEYRRVWARGPGHPEQMLEELDR